MPRGAERRWRDDRGCATFAAMFRAIGKYARWLHLQWPAGRVERLPVVGDEGRTAVAGVRVVGDLSGIPLLKFASETATRAVRAILAEPDFAGQRGKEPGVLDLAVVGAGVGGIAAAIEARKAGLRIAVYEAARPFATLANFPKGKPIFTYPTGMIPSGGLGFGEDAATREALLESVEAQQAAHGIEVEMERVERVVRREGVLEVQFAGDREAVRALRVIVAIGRSGNHRKLGCPGEDLAKVTNRLHDPMDFTGKDLLVVGGGDSALEAAIALAGSGARVTLSYRKREFARPKPDNIDKIRALERDPAAAVTVETPVSERQTAAFTDAMREATPRGSLRLALGTRVARVEAETVTLVDDAKTEEQIPNDAVFSMIGREAPLEFFRRSGIPIRGELSVVSKVLMGLFVAFCIWLYHWKSGAQIPGLGSLPGWANPNPATWFAWAGEAPSESLAGVVRDAASKRSFYYTLSYCLLVVGFGWVRIRRRKTPYVKLQTLTLMTVQCLPLFLLPEILLPWAGRNHWFDAGAGGWIADQLFPAYDPAWPAAREYWRAYGLILAWPLFIYNWFTEAPLWGWLVVGAVQTFVLIPLMVWRWGKGAYCGWICSCGALAETVGDAHRHKMPHGPFWNRLNFIGQVFLLFAAVLLGLRVLGWAGVGWASGAFKVAAETFPVLNYKYLVDLFFAGILGVAFYFWYSGRIWCRFACPLAALMHIYARFSRFRIFADKKKCISCNVCTSVCHQGIDIMSFANKGMPMEDPECVRCSACVQQCPTGVLTFGRLGEGGVPVLDRLAASPVQMNEKGRGLSVGR